MAPHPARAKLPDAPARLTGVPIDVRWGLVAVLLMGIGLRITALDHRVRQGPDPATPTGRAAALHDLALEVQNGYLAGPEHRAQAPLYPLFLGGLYRLVGPRPARIWAIQSLLGLLLLLLVFRLGWRLHSPQAGVIAAGLVALQPSVAFVETDLAPTALLGVGLVGTLLLLCWARDHQRPWPWLPAGVALGVLCWGHPGFALLPGLLGAAGLWRLRRGPAAERPARLARGGFATLGLLLALAPAGRLAGGTTGSWELPIPTHVAQEVYAGNRPGATGWLEPDLPPLPPPARTASDRGVQGARTPPSEASRRYLSGAVGWALENPGAALLGLARKLWHLVGPTPPPPPAAPDRDGAAATALRLGLAHGASLLWILAALGWWLAPPRGRGLLAAALGSLVGAALLTAASREARALLLPLLAIPSATALLELSTSPRPGRARILVAGALGLLSFWLAPATERLAPHVRAEQHCAHAAALARQGRPEAAHRQLQRCLRLAPSWLPAWTALGENELQRGQRRAGRRRLQSVSARAPHALSPRLLLARDALGEAERASQRGDRAATTDWMHRAMVQVERARELAPEAPEALLLDARIRRALGHLRASERLLRAALRADPTHPETHIALGEAAALNRLIARARAHFHLAMLLGGSPDPDWVRALEDAEAAGSSAPRPPVPRR